jgi:type IV pilus assembly protein PilA
MLKLKLNDDRQLEGPTSSGFSLIELLIVVAIILIIAAIAIPNLIRARIAANQASAVESCRTITSAEVLYNVAYDNGFAPTLDALGGPASGAATAANAQLIDEGLSSGEKSGYVFTYAATNPDSTGAFENYTLNADPIDPTTGVNHYYTDQPAVIHMNVSAKASPADPPIQ